MLISWLTMKVMARFILDTNHRLTKRCHPSAELSILYRGCLPDPSKTKTKILNCVSWPCNNVIYILAVWQWSSGSKAFRIFLYQFLYSHIYTYKQIIHQPRCIIFQFRWVPVSDGHIFTAMDRYIRQEEPCARKLIYILEVGRSEYVILDIS